MSVVPIDPKLKSSETDQATQKPRLRSRHTLNRLALALAGVTVAAIGQSFFNQQSLWDGLLLYGVAVILFSYALADRVDGYNQAAGWLSSDSLALAGGWRLKTGVWLVLLAVGISMVAFNFFGDVDARRQAWWIYMIGLALFVSGGLLLSTGTTWRSELKRLLPDRRIVAGVVLVMGLALFMRLFNFTGQPYGVWYDESEVGLLARQMINDPTYRPIFFRPPINHPIFLPGAYALALAWLGDTIYSMRMVSVLLGLGGVLFAYLFGRELRGPRFGLALAFLVAVARWHVNFSRIAMTGIDTPFFEFLSLFFLVRLLRRGRLRDTMWLGLTLGTGLMVYTGFRLYIIALILCGFIVALRRNRLVLTAVSHGRWKAQLGRVAMIVIPVWLLITPAVKFAVDNPETFWYRTRQISIFNKRDQPDLGLALRQSTAKHLLMFNFQGDPNGRHNLPGEPMLDPVMGILAVLGFGLALARTRKSANTFFLILLPISLLGGILSVDFEAPHSLRSIAVFPAVIYFIGLALAALGREAEGALKLLPGRIWLAGPAVILASFMLLYNGYTYFVRQAKDFASWVSFSTAETITARKMAELGPDYIYYLSPFLTNHPALGFLAPDITDQRPLLPPNPLPIREQPVRPVALFIHNEDTEIYEQAKRLYPNASFEVVSSPFLDGPGRETLYFVDLQPADLAAIQGLELRYLRRPEEQSGSQADQLAPPLLKTERALIVNTTWPAAGPGETDFVAEWQGILYVPQYGSYGLRLVTPGPGQLEIDGNLVLDGQGEQTFRLLLAEGNHSIRVQAESAPGQVGLYWEPPDEPEALIPQWALYVPPITNHGLHGLYYPNARWEGRPALERIDPVLDTYFHLLPLDRPYTVEWTGALEVPQSGLYRLGLRAVTEAQLFLDGHLLVATTAPDRFIDAPVALAAGRHDILVRFKDSTDRSRIHLSWTTPAGVSEPIPSEYLWPPLGHYPERTPTISQVEVKPLSLTWLLSLGFPGTEPGQFFEPRDVAVLANGNVVVADTANRRVQILDSRGTPVQILTGDEFPFEEPLAVAVNSQDEILVLDSTLQYVYRYDSAGGFIDRFAGPAAALFHPRGLTIFEDDTVALADTGTSRVVFFSPDGSALGSIGSLGSDPGQLNEPTDVLQDSLGTLFVVEAMNSRLQRVDAGGSFLASWAVPATAAYDGPHLAFGPDDSIFMTEAQSSTLFRYGSDGSLLDQWQTVGPANLVRPVGLYFDPATQRLYVTDVGTHQVHVFEVDVEE